MRNKWHLYPRDCRQAFYDKLSESNELLRREKNAVAGLHGAYLFVYFRFFSTTQLQIIIVTTSLRSESCSWYKFLVYLDRREGE